MPESQEEMRARYVALVEESDRLLRAHEEAHAELDSFCDALTYEEWMGCRAALERHQQSDSTPPQSHG